MNASCVCVSALPHHHTLLPHTFFFAKLARLTVTKGFCLNCAGTRRSRIPMIRGSARCCFLLRRRFFQLDSSSVFRDVFSSVPLAKAVRPMETDRHWGNLPQVKGRMSRRWAKSSRLVHERL